MILSNQIISEAKDLAMHMKIKLDLHTRNIKRSPLAFVSKLPVYPTLVAKF
jgi:hypothetical protein